MPLFLGQLIFKKIIKGRISMKYYFNKKIAGSFEDAVQRVTENLNREGFGVLTEIDVKTTLKKKLGEEFYNYKYWVPAIRRMPIKRY
jgi:hypothetical protein